MMTTTMPASFRPGRTSAFLVVTLVLAACRAKPSPGPTPQQQAPNRATPDSVAATKPGSPASTSSSIAASRTLRAIGTGESWL